MTTFAALSAALSEGQAATTAAKSGSSGFPICARAQDKIRELLPMNRVATSSPQPSPPQVCGGEGEEFCRAPSVRVFVYTRLRQAPECAPIQQRVD
jgi:hypothetical protein